ncbi:MAG: hypothetical protein ACK5MT_09285 [Actinomycetales bacterium]
MSLTYEPDPRAWIRVPADAGPSWGAEAAGVLARRQGVEPRLATGLREQLASVAIGEHADEDARWVCAVDAARGGVVLDLDWMDLGADAPDDVAVDDEAAGRTEEFRAGRLTGKRIIWVAPPDGANPDDDDSQFEAQVLYVARVEGTGLLVTLRSHQHALRLIVDSVPACERMLATMSAA